MTTSAQEHIKTHLNGNSIHFDAVVLSQAHNHKNIVITNFLVSADFIGDQSSSW